MLPVPAHHLFLLSGFGSARSPQRAAHLYKCQYWGALKPSHEVKISVQGVENKRTRELTEDELSRLRDEVEKYTIEGDLRRFNALNIKRLKEIQCYRGRRHIAVRLHTPHVHIPSSFA